MSVRAARDGFEGIVLDAVGTLIQPAPPVAEVYAEAARRQGVDLDPAAVKARFHQAFGADEVDDLRGPLATDEPTEQRRWRRIVAACLPEVPDPERAFAALWEHFGRPDAWRVFPDVAPALETLDRAGLRLRIASNFDRRLRRVVVGRPELAPWAEPLIISSEVGFRKPHPAFYRAACVSLGLPPGRVLCVGDDPENDVFGPRRAGLHAVLLDRDHRARGDLPAVADLTGLVAYLLG
ncbi:MAG: HAD-IA family hydrolase [Isosphaeraceae bacterium]|nr:HAD-IA family hydrolase [Isosphaeraceae bacterium]